MSADSPRRRLPRHKRVPEADRPPMALTDRDCALLRMVNDCRALRTDQIEALFFGSRSTAQFRLAKLFQHEYLNRHFLSVVSDAPARSPAIYTLGKRGARVLVSVYGYQPNELRLMRGGAPAAHLLDHLLAVNGVRVAVTLAARAPGLQLDEWQDETVFRARPDYVLLADKAGRQRQKPVFPDGYFVLTTPLGKSRFFLELDRGTEPLGKVSPQIAVYEQYVTSGQYQARFKARSLRILIVTTSERRLESLKRVVAKVGGDGKYWFTTLDKVKAETVLTEPIWQRLGTNPVQPLIAAP